MMHIAPKQAMLRFYDIVGDQAGGHVTVLADGHIPVPTAQAGEQVAVEDPVVMYADQPGGLAIVRAQNEKSSILKYTL